ncbi:MAG: LacI family DNA-binding transcriptional regulator [Clostridia bacterium]|nr:LacI family DNA-binding transcriptional regulator [Clostridia bacterium]
MSTIKDIARRAGVSTATVSRVINDSDKVSSVAREAVLEAMRELQYYPNTIARSLKKESTMSIGVVIQDLSNSYLAEFCNSIENGVSDEGYLPLIASTNNNPQRERNYLEHMMQRHVDALVIQSCGKNNEFISEISQRIPTLAVYRRVEHEDYRGDFIDDENTTTMYTLTRHLLEKGHRSIFIINGPQDISSGYERYSGFSQAMRQFGIKIDKDYQYQFFSDYMRQGGADGCEKMLNMHDRATALITTNGELLLGALIYLRKQQVRIPEDLSVVSYSLPINLPLFPVNVTSAIQSPSTLGERAARLILERLKSARLPNREIIYPCPIEYGDSVRSLNSTP